MKKYILILIVGLLNGCEQKSTTPMPVTETQSAPASSPEPVDISKAKVSEPSETQRQITAYLLDPDSKKEGYIEKQVSANNLTIKQVYDILQSKGEQDIAIICKGGYNPQPPYYELTFDLFHGEKMADEFAGMDRNSPIHKLCMVKAYEHFNYLKANSQADLKYYVTNN